MEKRDGCFLDPISHVLEFNAVWAGTPKGHACASAFWGSPGFIVDFTCADTIPGVSQPCTRFMSWPSPRLISGWRPCESAPRFALSRGVSTGEAAAASVGAGAPGMVGCPTGATLGSLRADIDVQPLNYKPD